MCECIRVCEDVCARARVCVRVDFGELHWGHTQVDQKQPKKPKRHTLPWKQGGKNCGSKLSRLLVFTRV